MEAALINNGATPERKDIPPQANGDTCHKHPAGGRHHWEWADLLKLRRCSTCGEERVWKKRFEGQ